MHTAEQEKNEFEQFKLRKKQQKEAEAKRARSPEKNAICIITGQPFKLSILVLQNPSKHLGSTAWRFDPALRQQIRIGQTGFSHTTVMSLRKSDPSSGNCQEDSFTTSKEGRSHARISRGFVLPNLTNLFQ